MKLSAPIFRLKRQARKQSKLSGIPLSQVLDSVAVAQGFQSWSHLANHWQPHSPASKLLGLLAPGDLLLLAARPGEGKTVLGLEIACEAVRAGRFACFFSSEYAETEVRHMLTAGSASAASEVPGPIIDLAEPVSARHVMTSLSEVAAGAVAVIDYLQVMDQNRSEPELDHQIRLLKRFAAQRQLSLVFLSQVHRSFDPAQKPLPDFSDVRTPNPLDLSHFTKGCFLQGGEMRLQPAPSAR